MCINDDLLRMRLVTFTVKLGIYCLFEPGSMQTLTDLSLKPYNTFGIDVYADKIVGLHTQADISEAVDMGYFRGPHVILGGGSNVLFTRPVQGTVLLNRLKGIHVLKEDDLHIYIEAASGEVWHDVVMFAVDRGWGGIENLSLIPGTVGAAPMQNIGAYGVELTQVFAHLTAVDLQNGMERRFEHADCRFGYRESVFKNLLKGKYFIASVCLRLEKYPVLNTSYGAIREVLEKNNVVSPTVKDISDAVIAIRRSKLPDPAITGNAGSFFKNPELTLEAFTLIRQNFPAIPSYPAGDKIKIPAGWMIEQCGWKGYRKGDAGVHPLQALVLVNYGSASGAEITHLAQEIQTSVLEKFGVQIIPEVNIM